MNDDLHKCGDCGLMRHVLTQTSFGGLCYRCRGRRERLDIDEDAAKGCGKPAQGKVLEDILALREKLERKGPMEVRQLPSFDGVVTCHGTAAGGTFNAATLLKSEWIGKMDAAMLGKPLLEHEEMTDPGEATVDMDRVTKRVRETVEKTFIGQETGVTYGGEHEDPDNSGCCIRCQASLPEEAGRPCVPDAHRKQLHELSAEELRAECAAEREMVDPSEMANPYADGVKVKVAEVLPRDGWLGMQPVVWEEVMPESAGEQTPFERAWEQHVEPLKGATVGVDPAAGDSWTVTTVIEGGKPVFDKGLRVEAVVLALQLRKAANDRMDFGPWDLLVGGDVAELLDADWPLPGGNTGCTTLRRRLETIEGIRHVMESKVRRGIELVPAVHLPSKAASDPGGQSALQAWGRAVDAEAVLLSQESQPAENAWTAAAAEFNRRSKGR